MGREGTGPSDIVGDWQGLVLGEEVGDMPGPEPEDGWRCWGRMPSTSALSSSTSPSRSKSAATSASSPSRVELVEDGSGTLTFSKLISSSKVLIQSGLFKVMVTVRPNN